VKVSLPASADKKNMKLRTFLDTNSTLDDKWVVPVKEYMNKHCKSLLRCTFSIFDYKKRILGGEDKNTASLLSLRTGTLNQCTGSEKEFAGIDHLSCISQIDRYIPIMNLAPTDPQLPERLASECPVEWEAMPERCDYKVMSFKQLKVVGGAEPAALKATDAELREQCAAEYKKLFPSNFLRNGLMGLGLAGAAGLGLMAARKYMPGVMQPSKPTVASSAEPEVAAEPSKGMSTGVIVFLVILALVLALGGVYLYRMRA